VGAVTCPCMYVLVSLARALLRTFRCAWSYCVHWVVLRQHTSYAIAVCLCLSVPAVPGGHGRRRMEPGVVGLLVLRTSSGTIFTRLGALARPTNYKRGGLRLLGAGSRSGGEPLAHHRCQLTASENNRGSKAPGDARRILVCALRDGTKHWTITPRHPPTGRWAGQRRKNAINDHGTRLVDRIGFTKADEGADSWVRQ
jgi:hypothetical protein